MNTKLLCPTLAIAVAMLSCGRSVADESLLVEEMVVVLIDAVDVPANESGVIAEIAVREGTSVSTGEELARLDDRKAAVEELLARTQLEIATEKAENDLTTDLAEKKLAEQEQLAKQHAITREIADRKGKNEVRILALSKATGVAKNELDRALRAREQFVDSVSRSEIDGLRLAYEQSKLETEQADFERQLDLLHAKSEGEAATGHQISIDRSKIEVAQTIADSRVQKLQVRLQKHQSQLAELAKLQHRILAPLDGMVVERFRNQGDWVNAGDPVIRVIRLNRLRAEGFAAADKIDTLRKHRSVQLRIQAGIDRAIERKGEIVFISPEIDPVNNEVRFWVEFDNPDLDVLPGMHLSLRISP